MPSTRRPSQAEGKGDSPFRNKRVLVTGVCGTVGGELLRQVLALDPADVIGLDNDESALFFLRQAYPRSLPFRLYLADVRDRDALRRKMEGVDTVLHTAALKHVFLNEESPREAVQTNILGVQNVLDAALEQGVGRVLFTSSDKAVNPTSVMGTSKLMGERLMTAANALRRPDHPVFASTRFGNVLGSSGSVIPLFRSQIAAGGPVTLTDPSMTRFIMTLSEAVRLVMDSVSMAVGGEVFVTKMPVVRIEDLAVVMIEELAPRFGRRPSDVRTEVIGMKSGEKLYEELLNQEEIRRTVELEDYFVVLPALQAAFMQAEYTYPTEVGRTVDRPYNSSLEAPFSKERLREYLLQHDLLLAPGNGPAGLEQPAFLQV